MPTTTPPSAGPPHPVDWQAVEQILDAVERLGEQGGLQPNHHAEQQGDGGSRRPAGVERGTRQGGKSGPAPSSSGRQASETSAAITTGTKLRGFHSNQQHLDREQDRGDQSRRCRSCPPRRPRPAASCAPAALSLKHWAKSEPIAPPVMMIGPSAPNGPPLPIEMAEDKGLSSATLSDSRLSP